VISGGEVAFELDGRGDLEEFVAGAVADDLRQANVALAVGIVL
jgi:hypothetical protein